MDIIYAVSLFMVDYGRDVENACICNKNFFKTLSDQLTIKKINKKKKTGERVAEQYQKIFSPREL